MLTGKGALSNYCSESKPPGEQGAGEEFPEKHQDFTDVLVCKARLGAHQAKRVSVCMNFSRRGKEINSLSAHKEKASCNGFTCDCMCNI